MLRIVSIIAIACASACNAAKAVEDGPVIYQCDGKKITKGLGIVAERLTYRVDGRKLTFEDYEDGQFIKWGLGAVRVTASEIAYSAKIPTPAAGIVRIVDNNRIEGTVRDMREPWGSTILQPSISEGECEQVDEPETPDRKF